jgi:small-conductance mechanosensitive channel
LGRFLGRQAARSPVLAGLLLFAFACGALWAQETGVPVVVDGAEILRVYSPVGHFTAAERAPEIERRIVMLAEKGITGKLETKDLPGEKVTAIAAGPIYLMNVTDQDAEMAGVARKALAQKYAAAIQAAIENYRVSHTWRSFLWAVLKTLLAWTVFVAGMWLLWKAIYWLEGLVKRLSDRLLGGRQAGGFHMLLLERSRYIVMWLVRAFMLIASLFALSFLFSYTFSLYPQTAGISMTLLDYLRSTFGGIGKAFIDYLPSGGFVIVVGFLTRYLLKLLRFLASAVERGDLAVKGLHPEMAKPTYQITRIGVVMFALVVVFPYLPGGQSEAFKGISIFIGVVLSFGSSSSVGNVLAGLVLTYMRAFRIGDRVKIAETVGDILDKSLLVTRVRTIKNVEVVIPNGAVLGGQILNYSAFAREKGLILHTTVTIGYDAPWRTVHELLIRAALATDGVLPEPKPFVLQTSLNDFHISYEINAYTDRPNEMVNTYARLHEAIQDSFNRGGVEIMSPTFYALRDGNTVTTPEAHRPEGYQAPSFRVRMTGKKEDQA